MKFRKKDQIGRKRLQIQDVNGIKKNVKFACATQADLEDFKSHAKRLISCRSNGLEFYQRDEDWLKNQSKENKNRLATLGIVVLTPEEQAKQDDNKYSLDALIDRFLGMKRNHRVTKTTLDKWERYAKRVKRYFSHVRLRSDVRDVTQDDAEAYYSWTIDNVGLAEGSTANRGASYPRAFFNRAIKEKLIDVNPFANSKETSISYVVEANEDNWYIIPDREKEKIWNVLTDEVITSIHFVNECSNDWADDYKILNRNGM